MKLHGVLRVHQRMIVDFHPYRPSPAEIEGKGIPTSRWVARQGHRDQLAEWRNPVRPERVEPRCLKRRPQEYDRMTRPRAELRRRLKKLREEA